MKGFTLLLLAIVAGVNAQYYYPQPEPAFNFPTTQPPTTRPPPTQPVVQQTTPNLEYLPPREEQAVLAEVQETPAPTTRPTPPPTTRPPPPPPTTRPTPPPTTRPPPPPPTTRPPPPPTTRPPTTQAPPTPPPYYIPPVQEQDQAQIVFVTSAPTPAPTTRPPPPPTTTRPPPPPTTTQAPTTRPPVAPVVATTQGGYNYPKPEPEFPLLSDSANDNTVQVLVPTTGKPAPPPVAPVEAANEEHHHHDHDHHLFWDFRESIPGEPGQDYPILDSIPATSFSCKGRPTGYYADVEARCQVFHICVENPNGAAIQNSFLCPNGTIFNQTSFACQWWPDVDCSSSDQFYSLNENIGKVPEKPATAAPPARPPAPPAAPVATVPPPTVQPVVAAASEDQQQFLVLVPVSKPVADSTAPSVNNPVYQKPSQLYDAPPFQASQTNVDTVGLKPPSSYRK